MSYAIATSIRGKYDSLHKLLVLRHHSFVSLLTHLKCGLPVKFIVTDGTRTDCKEAINLIKNIDTKLSFADRAYDTNEILSYIAKRNMKPVIPSKRNRLEQHDYKGFNEKKQ